MLYPPTPSSCPYPLLTAQEISPFLSNRQKPLMSQGLEVEVLQDLCGTQPDVWFPTKPDLQGPHL